ncbi:hypothetical protein D3C81_982550 [compost metagenome]
MEAFQHPAKTATYDDQRDTHREQQYAVAELILGNAKALIIELACHKHCQYAHDQAESAHQANT